MIPKSNPEATYGRKSDREEHLGITLKWLRSLLLIGNQRNLGATSLAGLHC